MAADYPPFMNAYGNVSKILEKIKQAETPPRFTQEFLEKTLSFPGGSRKPFIPLAKRIGFIGSDGVPTEIYKRFQNPDRSKGAMAEAIRKGYPTLFERNQQAYKLDKNGLEGLIREATGLDADSGTLKSIAGTFDALKGFADFNAPGVTTDQKDDTADGSKPKGGTGDTRVKQAELSFSYTIYLNLPNTSEIAVFNAIFKSFRENILTA
jgi:hypothetical protein